MYDTEWGPFLKFKEPVDWSNLRIIHDPDIALSGLDGYSADSYRGAWRSEIERKYTRGWCHAFAAACTELHGGTLVSLMHKGKVAHVMALLPADDMFLCRDIMGDHWYVSRPDLLTADDFADISDDHLLGIEIDDILIGDAEPWSFPCLAPTREEIDEAKMLLDAQRAVAPMDEDGIEETPSPS